MLRQANVAEIRRTLEQKLSTLDVQRLCMKFQDAGVLPAAAIVQVNGVELRLEKDEFDGCWTIATNDRMPRLLDRLPETELGPSIYFTLEQSVAQLL